MKQTLVFFATLLFCVFATLHVSAQDIDSDLQSFYNFNNDTSSDIIDSGALGIDGDPISLTEDFCIIGNSYLFNGISSFIECGSHNRGISDEFTISAWIKTDLVDRQLIIAKHDWMADAGFYLRVTNEGNAACGGRVGDNVFYEADSDIFVSDGEWHHLIGVFDQDVFKIYVDCDLGETIEVVSNNPQFGNSLELTIGYNSVAPGDDDNGYFDGNIDEVRIYNRALSSTDLGVLCTSKLKACDDGDPCTENDMEEVNDCTGEICVPCEGEPIGECNITEIQPCDDLDPCTINDMQEVDLCDGRICEPCQGEIIPECSDTEIESCDDGNPCTIDDMQEVNTCDGSICEPCQGEIIPECSDTEIVTCDDGNPCTIDDLQEVNICDGSICEPCQGNIIPDCSDTVIQTCDDGNSCTINDMEEVNTCDGTICEPCQGVQVSCSDISQTSIVPCDDGDPNTINDTETILSCDGSICVPCSGIPAGCDTGQTEFQECDDGNPCTRDDMELILISTGEICEPCEGIVIPSCTETVMQACDDGDPCTVSDMEEVNACDGEICTPCQGTISSCDNEDDVTTQACDDGDPNTKDDIEIVLNCDGTICMPCAGTIVDCDSGIVEWQLDILEVQHITSSQHGTITISTNDDYDINWTGPGGFSSNMMSLDSLDISGCYTLSLIDNITNCTLDTTICIDDLTAVADIENLDFINIYPNPTNGIVNVKFIDHTHAINSIQLIDVTGRLKTEFLFSNQPRIVSIDLKGISAGVYIVQIQTKERTFLKRIILVE